MEQKQHQKYFFYVVLSIFSALMLYLFKAYIGVVILAITYAVVAQKPVNFFLKRFNWPSWLSSIFIIFLSVLLVFVPLGYFFISISAEINNLVIKFKIQNIEQAVVHLVEFFNSFLRSYPLLQDYKIQEEVVQKSIENLLNTYSKVLITQALNITGQSIVIVIKLVVFFFLIFIMTPNLPRLEAYLLKHSPLNSEITNIYITKFSNFVTTFVLVWVPVAFIQGMLGGAFLLIMRVPNAVLLTSLMILFSVVPVIGPGFIMAPVGIYYILTGNIFQGVAILLWYVIVVANIDNLLKSLFVSRRIEVNAVVLFVSFLAGLQVFGILGILYGPLITVLFLTSLDIYNKHYK